MERHGQPWACRLGARCVSPSLCITCLCFLPLCVFKAMILKSFSGWLHVVLRPSLIIWETETCNTLTKPAHHIRGQTWNTRLSRKSKARLAQILKAICKYDQIYVIQETIAHLSGRTRDLSIHCWDGNLLGWTSLWIGQHREHLSWLWILTLFYCLSASTLFWPSQSHPARFLSLENGPTGTMCASWSLFH